MSYRQPTNSRKPTTTTSISVTRTSVPTSTAPTTTTTNTGTTNVGSTNVSVTNISTSTGPGVLTATEIKDVIQRQLGGEFGSDTTTTLGEDCYTIATVAGTMTIVQDRGPCFRQLALPPSPPTPGGATFIPDVAGLEEDGCYPYKVDLVYTIETECVCAGDLETKEDILDEITPTESSDPPTCTPRYFHFEYHYYMKNSIVCGDSSPQEECCGGSITGPFYEKDLLVDGALGDSLNDIDWYTDGQGNHVINAPPFFNDNGGHPFIPDGDNYIGPDIFRYEGPDLRSDDRSKISGSDCPCMEPKSVDPELHGAPFLCAPTRATMNCLLDEALGRCETDFAVGLMSMLVWSYLSKRPAVQNSVADCGQNCGGPDDITR